MPKRQDSRVIRTRNFIIAGVTGVVILVLGYGTLYSTRVTEGDYQAGSDYEVIEGARGHRPGAPVVVREFFSYGCVHCRNFDPMVEAWRTRLPGDVEFRRTPAAFSPLWSLLGRAYLTLQQLNALELNHERLFSAIHDHGRQFLSAAMLADFVDGHGVSREEFLRTFNSPAIDARVRQAERDQRSLGIVSVPTLVVDDRYRVTMDVGRQTALDVVDYLITREQEPQQPAQ